MMSSVNVWLHELADGEAGLLADDAQDDLPPGAGAVAAGRWIGRGGTALSEPAAQVLSSAVTVMAPPGPKRDTSLTAATGGGGSRATYRRSTRARDASLPDGRHWRCVKRWNGSAAGGDGELREVGRPARRSARGSTRPSLAAGEERGDAFHYRLPPGAAMADPDAVGGERPPASRAALRASSRSTGEACSPGRAAGVADQHVERRRSYRLERADEHKRGTLIADTASDTPSPCKWHQVGGCPIKENNMRGWFELVGSVRVPASELRPEAMPDGRRSGAN
jgi:hypothetical protein